MGRITILESGLFTTIQDLGRPGYRRFGIPPSGAMDRASAMLANLLVNNNPDTAVMEITLTGPVIKFDAATVICLTGADLSARLDEIPMSINTPISVQAGQTLSFGKPQHGMRCYLAIGGGLIAEKRLGSVSQYFPVTAKSKLNTGDQLEFPDGTILNVPKASVRSDPQVVKHLEALPGPEYGLLTDQQQQVLYEKAMIVRENDRMGYHLDGGNALENSLSIITAPVIPGTVQLTPSGKIIILMRDAQVTGGYPRILQLAEESINHLAQKKTGERLNFIPQDQYEK